MTRAFAAILIATLCLTQIAPASAHGVSRVRKQLEERGYEQLEFRRKKAPFKLDACLDGERYHLHVDFYGKITERTSAGSCQSNDSQEEKTASDQDAPTAAQEEQDDGAEKASTSEAEDDEPVSDEAAAKAMRRWGVDLRKEPK